MLDRALRIVGPVVMGIVLILLVLRAFVPPEEQKPYSPPASVKLVLTVGTKGGLCATEDGRGEVCKTVDKIYSNGVMDGTHAHQYNEDQMAKMLHYINELETVDYSTVDLTDCGSSTFDGQDFYVLLPDANVEVEQCHVLPEEAETAYEHLLTLLATGVQR